MPPQKRCDICKLKANIEPKSLFDVLCYLSPPIDLLEAIDRWCEAAPTKVPDSIKDYRARWGDLMTEKPVPTIEQIVNREVIDLNTYKDEVTS